MAAICLGLNVLIYILCNIIRTIHQLNGQVSHYYFICLINIAVDMPEKQNRMRLSAELSLDVVVWVLLIINKYCMIYTGFVLKRQHFIF